MMSNVAVWVGCVWEREVEVREYKWSAVGTVSCATQLFSQGRWCCLVFQRKNPETQKGSFSGCGAGPKCIHSSDPTLGYACSCPPRLLCVSEECRGFPGHQPRWGSYSLCKCCLYDTGPAILEDKELASLHFLRVPSASSCCGETLYK